MQAAEEAIREAVRYETRCEALAALVEFARTMIEQARAAEAERARMAAEAAEAVAAAAEAAEDAAASERQKLEERRAALALEMQQMDAQLGVVAPAPEASGGGTVRGVYGRAQEMRGAAVHAHVHVRGVHPAAGGAGCAELPGVPRAHRAHERVFTS